MEISGISGSSVNQTIGDARNKVREDSFEKQLNAALTQGDREKLKQVCSEFESILLGILYRQMKATVPKSEFFLGSIARDVFESMLDDRLIQEAAKSGGMGLAQSLYRQLSSLIKPGQADGEE